MLEIRTAKEEEFENVVSFYDAVIDGMQNAESKPGWKKGIYPDEKIGRASCRERVCQYV